MTQRRKILALGFGLLVALSGAVFVLKPNFGYLSLPGRGGERDALLASATYTGRQSCAGCHPREQDLWSGSHHDLAMQVADEETVLGDFEGATHTYFDVTSTFYKLEGKFYVRTDGPGGELRDYEIAYTFGVSPLQQYLIEFPGGRYQALGIAWDTRPKEAGGQRWFHLYPNEPILHDHVLHWTGRDQTWNFMCASCHSTDLRKNYDFETDSYETTWSEVDVSCEACHGPGSSHIAWAEGGGAAPDRKTPADDVDDASLGLLVRLGRGGARNWTIDATTGTASRATPLRSSAQVDVCAPCHSRRAQVGDDYVPGRPLLDTYQPRLLTEELYYADGQIYEEVYVYGSFLQSKMYHAGVTCSDCHDAHSLTLHATGNALCSTCHLSAKFDSPSHHFHQPGSAGASCVDCHMATRTYMVVDPRRDHSLRVPRPDLSVKLGTPNACNACHGERSAEWAAQRVDEWYGPERLADTHYGELLHTARVGEVGAEAALASLAGDTAQPSIARATALSLLPRYMTRASAQTVQRALDDKDPLLRLAALDALEVVEPGERVNLAYPLLSDSLRAVRIQAARVLAAVPPDNMTPAQRVRVERGISEFIEAQLVNADRAEAHLNLGILYATRGQFADAEAAYRTALRLEPSFVQAYVNLADLYRAQGRDVDGERALLEALDIAPDEAATHHALGLLLARQQRLAEALGELARAAELDPDNPRFAYVYGVALNSSGDADRALTVLERAHQRRPDDTQVLYALVTINRDTGAFDAALRYARKLVERAPQDPGARQLLEQLQAATAR